MNLKLQPPTTQNVTESPMSIDTSSIERTGNHIYFYAEVEREKALSVNKAIRETARELVVDAQSKDRPHPDPIYLHIQSFGGSIFAGLSIRDEIQRSLVPVITVIEGCAASAATMISIAGNHRQISKNAFMLIHQLSSAAWGNFRQLSDEQQNNELLMQTILQIYGEDTKIPPKKLAEILGHDLWWDAKTCLKYGLVDEII